LPIPVISNPSKERAASSSYFKTPQRTTSLDGRIDKELVVIQLSSKFENHDIYRSELGI
jgi:hypothetical protein